MSTQERLLLSFKWGRKAMMEPSVCRLDVHLLRRTTVRELFVHVLKEISFDLSLEMADSISLSVVQHVEEISSFGESKKRPKVKFNASRMYDDEVYDLMQDMSTRQFDFVVTLIEPEVGQEQTSEIIVCIVFVCIC